MINSSLTHHSWTKFSAMRFPDIRQNCQHVAPSFHQLWTQASHEERNRKNQKLFEFTFHPFRIRQLVLLINDKGNYLFFFFIQFFHKMLMVLHEQEMIYDLSCKRKCCYLIM